MYYPEHAVIACHALDDLLNQKVVVSHALHPSQLVLANSVQPAAPNLPSFHKKVFKMESTAKQKKLTYDVIDNLNITLPLGHFSSIRVQKDRDVREVRRFEVETGVEVQMKRIREKPLLATQYVGYAHLMVVNNRSEMVCWEEVGFEQDRVRRK